jgi:hypothetical protein
MGRRRYKFGVTNQHNVKRENFSLTPEKIDIFFPSKKKGRGVYTTAHRTKKKNNKVFERRERKKGGREAEEVNGNRKLSGARLAGENC